MKKIFSILILTLFFNCCYVFAADSYNPNDLSDYFGTKKACTNDGSENDCRNGDEYKFYLKMYDIFYLYKNKYNVKLDLPLIMATLYYNNEQLPTVFKLNLNDYNRNDLKDTSKVTNLDWEYDYENASDYYYLDSEDFRYDMQILAKNMVRKTITYKCSDGTSKEAKDIETSNYSNETLKCDNGTYEANSVSEKYEYDADKYKEFLSIYIEKKYHTKSKGNKCANQTSKKVDGNILIGDSRFVGMCDTYGLCGNDKYVAKVGEGYNWFLNTAIDEVNKFLNQNKNATYNIFINLGVNDLDNDSKYLEKYKNLANNDWKNHNIYFVSVNPTEGSYAHLNDKITKFNSNMKNGIGSSINYCDVNSKIKDSFKTVDGLHYDKDTNKKIYDAMMECGNQSSNNCSTAGSNSLADAMVKFAINEYNTNKNVYGGAKYLQPLNLSYGTSWCAAFATYVTENAEYNGQRVSDIVKLKTARVGDYSDYFMSSTDANKKFYYNSSGNYYKNYTNYLPKPGDYIIFSNSGQNCSGYTQSLPVGCHDHIGIVEKQEDGYVYTIEGNSCSYPGCLNRIKYSLSDNRIVGYGSWY